MNNFPTSVPTVEKKILHPGEYHVARHPAVLSTLLGSCVSVCLYDPAIRLIGMNHFLLATQHPAAESILESDAGRYGMGAMELLINSMLKKGARRERLRAKAFGGGNVLATHLEDLPARFSIGKINMEFVQRYLREDGIPLVAQDLGGSIGRHIRFESEDYSVYMRRIPIRSAAQIAVKEKHYFEKELKTQQEKKNVDFW
ncbi:chemotaxis protein CheD [Rhodoferax sp. 4810]|uniref:Probable chemoreceptor glutamine deamidase CheD n=1 Tax=Thiospirillum jenense TaxID=1653858 RepID=A0A839HE08_9GAMM|nr:chemotaxis protein CheD [Thiospirillum jenense]MBB1077099.1 chemotaxis protein CheD [Rhodoferax jenense]MBB1127165.1 chemotaxis protein CheD [Thiospirillum jenense]